MMTTEELYAIIQTQQEEIEKLQQNFKALKEWSDLNDYWLREMIDALTESVEKNFDKININIKNINVNSEKIKELIEHYHHE